MRTNVVFEHPADFVPVSDEDGVLAVRGAQWFVDLLQAIPGLEIDPRLCQEDWGVAIFVCSGNKKFWVGLSMWPESDRAWLAHVHHGSFAWLQRFSTSGRAELERFVTNVHHALADNPSITNVVWYQESAMRKASPIGAATPGAG